LNDLLGGKSKQNILQEVNQKKYFTGCKPGNGLYYRGKALLTLQVIRVQIL